MYCNYKLEPGNWYEFNNVQMNHCTVYWERMRIKSIIKILKSDYKQIQMNQQKHKKIITFILDMIQFGLKKIIDYYADVQKFNDPKFKSDIFTSLHYLYTTENKPKLNQCVLGYLIAHNTHRSESTTSYCFNIKLEDRCVSLIYWNDVTRLYDWIGNHIKNNTINVYVDVQIKDIGYNNNKKTYLMISNNSYVIYDICPTILNLIKEGESEDNKIKNIKILWPRKQALVDHTLFKNLVVPEYKSFTDAMNHFDTLIINDEDNNTSMSVIAKIMSNKIMFEKFLDDIKISIKTYCNRCKALEECIKYRCEICDNKVKPWFQADTIVYIEENYCETNEMRLSIPLAIIRKIFKFCEKYGLTNKEVSNVIKKMQMILDNKNYKWIHLNECKVFVPLIKLFYENIKNKHKVIIHIMITKIEKDGKEWFNYKLHDFKEKVLNITNAKRKNMNEKSNDNTDNIPPSKKMRLN